MAAVVLLATAGTHVLVLDCLFASFGAGTESDGDPPDHECFCCCRHVIPSRPVALCLSVLAGVEPPPPSITLVSWDPPSVYHPPKA